jgi:hypothetical protein
METVVSFFILNYQNRLQIGSKKKKQRAIIFYLKTKKKKKICQKFQKNKTNS